ncbi:MAG: hypothetical protein HOC91_00195 [Nitrospinaceae bacterium]|nr:hypothetical protein [Nitrospinaceae bacterium]MBT3821726.1 hypothetical protein [Nitrospinaceae bacterium]MBT4092915.1 hypothetical protein [Nitrospinaceae bacterium]MBT4428914.1 hypothetical protein [Nitrospinaceae bacterium]MBT5366584.1 hypothetical protein [Nitrospinaceae bacterium]
MLHYQLNKLVHEIQFPDKRALFDQDPEAFIETFNLSAKELSAVKDGDVRALWNMGVNPYLLRVYQIWKGISDDEYRAALEGLSFYEPQGGVS